MSQIKFAKKHWRQLDSLRAIAVIGVLIHHFWGTNDYIDLGLLGVQLFFVLSGFLITGILLHTRRLIESGVILKSEGLKIFYIRRALRIFPIYYIAIFILWLCGDSETKESFWWLVSYLTNFHFTHQGWFNSTTAHLWTLAVEQQFYLLWPFIILFIPRNKLMHTIILMVISGPLFRLYVYFGFSEIKPLGGYILTFANTDSLGMGALLAYFEDSEKEYDLTIKIIGLYLSLPFIFIGQILNMNEIIYDSLSISAFSMLFMWVIYKSKIGFSGFTGSALDNPMVRYIGKISYGLYLYHFCVIYFIRKYTYVFILIDNFNLAGVDLSKNIKFAILVSCTLAISIFSYHFIENPINRLKRFFVY